ncbi:hypothetical protein CHUAL_011980 [Chamberlinius hualienensis]
MNKGKKIEGSLSSLVDLKAELFRKQEEAKRNKAKNDISNVSLRISGKLKAELDTHDKGRKTSAKQGETLAKTSRALQIEDDNEETRRALDASRKKLEEKAKLYDKLTSSYHVNDEEELYMVDFNRKVLYNEVSKPVPVADDVVEVNEDSYKSKKDDEEWVEYTDSLGRSRKCFKKDLPQMKAMDMELQKKNAVPPPISLLEDVDYEIEEKTPSEAPNPVGPVHYQNVQHNEIRDHGVGYYRFSKDEDERSKQMDLLENLRNQTKEQRTRREKLKEQRKNALKDRLKKVKQRKLMATGQDVTISESESSNEDELLDIKNAESIPIPVTVEREEDDKPPTVRPWDRGKIGVRIAQPFKKATQNDWIDERRSERLSEFAPPQFYNERDKRGESARNTSERQHEFTTPQIYTEHEQRVESIHQFFKETQMNIATENPQDIPLPL